MKYLREISVGSCFYLTWSVLPIFQTMKVRLQPPSGTELAPFNPILPPAAITQVMLLANPLKVELSLDVF